MARSPALIRTRFGPGKLARSLYWLAGAVVAVPLLTFGQRRSRLFSELEQIGILACAAVLGSLLALVARSISGSFRKRQQRRRDRRSQAIFEAARAGSAPDFSLYLRAFETTGGMREERDVGMFGETEDTDFETELAEAVEKDIPLVALGRPGEQEGAGRMPTSDAKWQADIEVLAGAALVLFLLPSTRSGTLWELDWVSRHGMWHRTIFVQPPAHRKRWFAKAEKRFDWETAWREVIKAGQERSIAFPEFRKGGAFFTLGADKRVEIYTPMRAALAFSLAPRINRHLKAMARARLAKGDNAARRQNGTSP